MGKFISNYNELPVPNKRIYDLVQSKSDGTVKVFAEMIGVKQQVLDRIFKKDPRNGKYPSISDKIKEGLKNTFGLDDVWLLTGESQRPISTTRPNSPKTLHEILEEKNISPSIVGEALGVQPSDLKKYDNMRDRTINEIISISKATGISLSELLGSNEIPLLKKENDIPHIKILESDIQEGTLDGTPVYDIDATCGPNNRSIDFTKDIIVGSVNLPEIDKDSKIVFASGDSMLPLISNGDRVVIREIESWDFIYYGQIYLILTNEYRMVKYIRKHPTNDKEYVILRSKNPEFDDIELPRREIKRLFVVENILSIKNVL